MEVGQIESLLRYPVKSMAGHELTAAHLGWHRHGAPVQRQKVILHRR